MSPRRFFPDPSSGCIVKLPLSISVLEQMPRGDFITGSHKATGIKMRHTDLHEAALIGGSTL